MTALFEYIYRIFAGIFPYDWADSTFIVRALLGLMLLTPLCGAIGINVVNFRMAFFSDTISHSAFTGVALGILFGLNPWITLAGFGILIGLGIVRVKRNSELSSDTIIGVFFSTVIAAGIAIISFRRGLTRDLQAYIFGDILTISENEVAIGLFLFVLAIAFISLTYNKLLLIGLHEDMASSKGLNTTLYEYLHAALLAAVVTFSIRAVGLLLVTALLILPAASARNVARNAGALFWWSIALAILAGILGLIISLVWNLATGAAIILVASLFFFITNLARLVRRHQSPL